MSDGHDTPPPAGQKPYDHQPAEQPAPTQPAPTPPSGQPGQPGQSPYGHHPGTSGEPTAGQPVAAQPVPGQPEGHGYPPGYGPPPGFATAAEPTSGTKVGAGLLWSLLAAVALAVAVSVKEDGQNGWERIGVWAGFAIVAALATAVPAIRSNLNLDAEKAWKISAAGAVGLIAFWVLFILPSIEQNVSFLATLGCAAGAMAAWTAPGSPDPDPGSGDRGKAW